MTVKTDCRAKLVVPFFLAATAALMACSSEDPDPPADTVQAAEKILDLRPGTRPARKVIPLVIDTIPDHPQGFGRKAFWFAIKSDDEDAVANVLQLTNRQPANWITGMKLAFGRNIPKKYESFVYVAPPVRGWVFVLSPHFYATGDQMNPKSGQQAEAGFDLIFASLYQAFPDVQAFGSHRGVSAIKWARAIDGKAVRIFSLADGEVYANFGALSAEEHAIDILDIGGLSTTEAQNAIYENDRNYFALEEKLMASGMDRKATQEKLAQTFKISPGGDEDLHFYLAEKWSLSPENLGDMELDKGVGIIGELPEAMLAWPESMK